MFYSLYSFTGSTTKAMNLGSYNYLGFAENVGPCASAAETAIKENGIGIASNRLESGQYQHLAWWSRPIPRFDLLNLISHWQCKQQYIRVITKEHIYNLWPLVITVNFSAHDFIGQHCRNLSVYLMPWCYWLSFGIIAIIKAFFVLCYYCCVSGKQPSCMPV